MRKSSQKPWQPEWSTLFECCATRCGAGCVFFSLFSISVFCFPFFFFFQVACYYFVFVFSWFVVVAFRLCVAPFSLLFRFVLCESLGSKTGALFPKCCAKRCAAVLFILLFYFIFPFARCFSVLPRCCCVDAMMCYLVLMLCHCF